MDNQQAQDSQRQEELQEVINAGEEYEQLVRLPAWGRLLRLIQAQIAAFTNRSLNGEFKTMEDFKQAAGEINGMRRIVGEVDNTLRMAREQHDKAKNNRPATDSKK